MPERVFDLIVDSVPIVCIDVIPVDTSSTKPKLGIITRATGPEQGKLVILGGRIRKDETISAAIERHLSGSFGQKRFSFHEGNSEERPFYVAQYAHAPGASGKYDPTKHSIGLTYLINIENPKSVYGEASEFRWIALDEIPGIFGYNQHQVILQAAKFLARPHARP